MPTIIQIKNSPTANDLWKGIGGHFDSFSQIMCEFIDNSISNFIKNKVLSKSIIIKIKERSTGKIFVSIEDSGTGMYDLDVAFSLGNKAGAETPLNEHGFGLKHALASADIENLHWKVCSRTKSDFTENTFKKISASYKIDGYEAAILNITEESWPGELNGSGTYIEFTCESDLFNTLKKGIGGNISNFETLLDIFSEDLGYIYSGIIQENKATITILGEDKTGNSIQKSVAAILPNWLQYYSPGQGEKLLDLGGGTVKMKYSFGSINASVYKKYYRKNMSSSGLEIRINGRVLESNLFKEVWLRERHNMYNHLLVMVDIISENRLALPVTRTSKNGLREGDGKFERILEWVRNSMPDPFKEIDEAHDESDLFDMLEKYKKTHIPDPKTVSREQKVYKGIKEKIPVDLYIHSHNEVVLYEGKKDFTGVKDVYQLKMYWDGAVLDGIQPTQGILISANHPDSVKLLIDYVNQMKDLNGKNYNFTTKTWIDESVTYPK